MTKSHKTALLNYFTATSDGKHYICQCRKENNMQNEKRCAAKISAISSADKSSTSVTAKTSNLKRHLQRFHLHVFHVITAKDCDESVTCSSEQQATPSLKAYFHTSKVTVAMNKENFKKYIIEMVVKSNILLSFFSIPAFLGLNGEMARKVGISLDRVNIRKLITKKAKEKRMNLRKF